MIYNDVLRSIRYALDLSDAKVAALFALSGRELTVEQTSRLLKKEDESGFVECSAGELTDFLDGLIVDRRGRLDSPSAQAKAPVPYLTNNAILKKLRVAFAQKDEDMHKTLALAGFSLSKPELNALFRQSNHKNYRPCGDQLLRNFLKGMVIRLRGSQEK